MIRQSKTKRVKIATMMARATFRQGIEDYLAGRPLVDHDSGTDCWTYERGRLYAATRGPLPFKKGRVVLEEAIAHFVAQRRAKFIL